MMDELNKNLINTFKIKQVTRYRSLPTRLKEEHRLANKLSVDFDLKEESLGLHKITSPVYNSTQEYLGFLFQNDEQEYWLSLSEYVILKEAFTKAKTSMIIWYVGDRSPEEIHCLYK